MQTFTNINQIVIKCFSTVCDCLQMFVNIEQTSKNVCFLGGKQMIVCLLWRHVWFYWGTSLSRGIDDVTTAQIQKISGSSVQDTLFLDRKAIYRIYPPVFNQSESSIGTDGRITPVTHTGAALCKDSCIWHNSWSQWKCYIKVECLLLYHLLCVDSYASNCPFL